MSDQLHQRLFTELDSIRLIDPHSHIEPKSAASKTLADILGYHYYTELCHSAGMPRADIEDPGIGPEEKVRRLVERIEPRFQLFVSAHVVEAALDEEQPARKVRPRGLVDGLAGEARDTALGSRTDVLVRIRVAGAFRRYAERNDREMRRQHAIDVEVVDRGQELAPAQITGSAENNQLARLRQQCRGTFENLGGCRSIRVRWFHVGALVVGDRIAMRRGAKHDTCRVPRFRRRLQTR